MAEVTNSSSKGYELPEDVMESFDPTQETGEGHRDTVRGYDAVVNGRDNVGNGIAFDVNGEARRVLKGVSGPKVVRGDVRVGEYDEDARGERMESLKRRIGEVVSSKFRISAQHKLGKSDTSLYTRIGVEENWFSIDLSEINARGVVDITSNGILPSQVDSVSDANKFARDLMAHAQEQFRLCLDRAQIYATPVDTKCGLKSNIMTFSITERVSRR